MYRQLQKLSGKSDLSKRIATVLALSLVFQSFLSFFSAPAFVETADGRTVVLCTLQGLKTVSLASNETTDSSSPEQDFTGYPLCPACLLLAHAASAVPSSSASLAVSTAFTIISSFVVTDIAVRSLAWLTQAPIRAPPASIPLD